MIPDSAQILDSVPHLLWQDKDSFFINYKHW